MVPPYRARFAGPRTYASDSTDEFGDLIGEDGEYIHQYDAQSATHALLDNTGSAVEAKYKYYAFGLPAAVSVGGSAWSNDTWAGLSVNQWAAMSVDDWAGLPVDLTTQMLAGGKKQYYMDPETQLYLLGSGQSGAGGVGGRYYDPVTARFQSQDPIRHQAGDANLYRYVENNPVNRLDPGGHDAASDAEKEKQETAARKAAADAANQQKGDAAAKGNTNAADAQSAQQQMQAKQADPQKQQNQQKQDEQEEVHYPPPPPDDSSPTTGSQSNQEESKLLQNLSSKYTSPAVQPPILTPLPSIDFRHINISHSDIRSLFARDFPGRSLRHPPLGAGEGIFESVTTQPAPNGGCRRANSSGV